MITCGEDCHTICLHCVYMYKDHNPDLHAQDKGLCTVHREAKRYKMQACDSFHCRGVLTNDLNDERILSQKAVKTRENWSIRRFLKNGLRINKRSQNQ
jgi:hypothetical protein